MTGLRMLVCCQRFCYVAHIQFRWPWARSRARGREAEVRQYLAQKTGMGTWLQTHLESPEISEARDKSIEERRHLNRLIW